MKRTNKETIWGHQAEGHDAEVCAICEEDCGYWFDCEIEGFDPYWFSSFGTAICETCFLPLFRAELRSRQYRKNRSVKIF